MVEPDHQRLSITKQCELINISRSSWYYEILGESTENLELMRLIDEQFMKTPNMEPGRWPDIYGARDIG